MKNLQKLNKFLEKIDKNAKDQFIKIYRTTDKRSELEWNTARPLNMMFLVPEKNHVAQNRTSWGLYLCTKGHLFLFNHFIDMRTTFSLSKNVFLLKFSSVIVDNVWVKTILS